MIQSLVQYNYCSCGTTSQAVFSSSLDITTPLSTIHTTEIIQFVTIAAIATALPEEKRKGNKTSKQK